MKIKDKYSELKKQKEDFLVLIKSGTFYVTYYDDAKIMSYIFNYQINNDKIGFPISNLENVTRNLETQKISYYIYTDENTIKDYQSENNNYFNILNQSLKFINDKFLNDSLLSRISTLIKVNPNNYQKIKDFIDQL